MKHDAYMMRGAASNIWTNGVVPEQGENVRVVRVFGMGDMMDEGFVESVGNVMRGDRRLSTLRLS
jgi:hypothetical protein